MELKKVLTQNYMPYAVGTIVGRAIPAIDALKPSQRRILYTMYKMGLLKGNKTKSSNIVGQSMSFHPHGDSSIYDTLIRMATGNESLNVPYIESKGNFGKVYSSDLAYAAARYTEAKLAPICEEIFDGIDEDAVDMVDNFDNTKKEPSLLPVKFPSILVNSSSGIAVGMSSSIPSFGLREVCNATIGIIKGDIANARELMSVLGTPEYTTGGHIHASDEDLIRLGETGKVSLTISGTATTYPNRIVVTEIPYKTTVESITAAIEEAVKSGELKGVADARDDTDLKGFRLIIEIKRGFSSQEILKKIYRLTNLRMQISYNTSVIINNECKELGLLSLLKEWIAFRIGCIDRIYKFRYNKVSAQEHLLSAWEKISEELIDVAKLIIDSAEDDSAKELLKKQYNMDDAQAEYIMDIKARMLTKSNLEKKLKELAEARQLMSEYSNIIASEDEKKKIIMDDLTRISKKYGTDKKTQRAAPIVETIEKEEKVIDNTKVAVILTKGGYLKRLVTLGDVTSFKLPEGEEELTRWLAKNSEYLLVFTYSGEVHKILVDSIDASRGALKEKLATRIGLNSDEDIMYVDISGDYRGYFNIVYYNGRGVRVNYSKVAGNRTKYRSVYEAGKPGTMFITKADKFFMITAKRKASYCDLTIFNTLPNRTAFKVARVPGGDRIYGLQPIERVPDINSIDISKYNKEYCVSIGKDQLW